VLGAHAALVLALPVAAALLAAERAMSPVVMYGLWWFTAALPLARGVLRDSTLSQANRAPRAHAVWTWMPFGLVLWHLWSVGYIHTLDFRAPLLAPLLLGAALTLDRRRQALQLALPALAVLMSAGTDPGLQVDLAGLGVASPLRLALVGAGLVWAYLGWRDRNLWLAALPIGGAAVYLLAPYADRLARALARLLSESFPRERYGWGVVTVIAAFVLLAAGARRSLYGEPRWPEGGRREARRGDVRRAGV
jgi:hypothetical protein